MRRLDLVQIGLWITCAALLAMAGRAGAQTEAPVQEPVATGVVQLPPMVVEGDDRWKLPDEVRDAIWSEQQREIEFLLRERSRRARRDALISAEKSGRLRFELLPGYDPEVAREIYFSPGNERSEVVEIFRLGF